MAADYTLKAEITANASSFESAVKQANSSLTDLTGSAQQAGKSVNKTAEDTGEQVSKTAEETGSTVSKTAKETKQDVDKTSDSVGSGLGKSTQTAAQKLGSLGSTMTKTGKSLVAVSAPVTALGVAAVATSIDFESAFAGVKKTVNGTEAQFDTLRKSIMQMSTETASSKSEIAGVMEVLGQLGVNLDSGTDNMTNMTKVMIELGDATNLSAEEAATSLAHFMNITGASQGEVSNLGSAIVDLGNNFATDEASIVSMSTRLASAGTIAGLSAQDILALSTAMSSVGIEAEAGGTAMTQTLTGIQTAISDWKNGSTDALDTVASVAGMSAAQFYNCWSNDPMQALTLFIGGLGDMNAAGEDTWAVLDELGMSGIRQSNMLQSLSLATDQLTEATKVSNTAWDENVALQNEASQRYQTTESKISQAKESLSNLGVELGDSLLPVVSSLCGGLSAAASALGAIPTPVLTAVTAFAGIVTVVGSVITWLGSLLTSISTIVTAIGGGGILASAGAACATAFSGIGTAVEAVGAALVAFVGSPVALVVAAVAALVAAGVALYMNWETISTKAAEYWGIAVQSVKDNLSEAAAAFSQSGANIKAGLSKLWSNIKNDASAGWAAVTATVSSAWSKIKSNVTSAGSTVKAGVSTAWSSIQGATSSAWSTVSSTVSSAWNTLKSTVTSGGSGIKTAVSNTWSSIKSTTSSVWSNVVSTISSSLSSARSVVSQGVSKLKSLMNFSWSLPKLKLPHISVSGKFSLSPPSAPKFSVSWYAKAMKNGMILNSPTIFGASGGTLLGAGEAGSETVVGTNSLMNMIQNAVTNSQSTTSGEVTINVYGAEGQNVTELAEIVQQKITQQINRRDYAWA